MKPQLYNLSAYDYYLPKELIAQKPVEPRDSSRLLVVHRQTGRLEHRVFRDLPEYLERGDLLVFNVSKVIPARLRGRKPSGGRVEILLLEKVLDGVWKCLVKPGKSVKEGHRLIFERDGRVLTAHCVGRAEEGTRILNFGVDDETLFSFGNAPLPHYVRDENIPLERYQTVYAKYEGSVAAPTAGLHFTPELIENIKKKGVETAEVVLHVGVGTFRPVKVSDVRRHVMHEEFYLVSEETVSKIRNVRALGGRIVAVGTTTVRTLETLARLPEAPSYTGKTNLFIYPPFDFRLVDALITNFHLPKSTLLMLVSAFAGYELTMKFYSIAVEEKYRFFSFGDACLII